VEDAKGLGAASAATRVVTVQPEISSPPPDEVHWTLTGPNSVTFDWRGPANVIRYGRTAQYGSKGLAHTPDPLPFSSAGPFWEARLTGLEPGTLYHYSIGGSEDHVFKTAAAPGSANFKVCVQGDVGSTRDYAEVGPVQSLIAARQPDFTLVVGDITYASPKGQPSVDQHFNDVMVWSRDAAYMPVWGNHEWTHPELDDMRNYKGRFELPNPQTSPGAPFPGCCGEDWSWFDYGNTRFISYPEEFDGAWADWAAKAAPIMDAAQANPDIAFIVVFGHKPPYSSGSYSPGLLDLRALVESLARNHSKLVLLVNGHDHNYQRSFP